MYRVMVYERRAPGAAPAGPALYHAHDWEPAGGAMILRGARQEWAPPDAADVIVLWPMPGTRFHITGQKGP